MQYKYHCACIIYYKIADNCDSLSLFSKHPHQKKKSASIAEEKSTNT